MAVPSRPSSRWSFGRLARGAAGALLGATAGWIAAAVVVGGDAASPLPGLIAAAVLGVGVGILGLRAQSRPVSAILAVGALAALAFWILAPNGWWALPPPRAGEVQIRPAP